jgi:hypothetical protein
LFVAAWRTLQLFPNPARATIPDGGGIPKVLFLPAMICNSYLYAAKGLARAAHITVWTTPGV